MKIDLTGKKFNMLSVVKKADFEKYKGNTTWECVCDCGTTTYATTHELTTNKTKSCGCLRHRPDNDLTGKKFNLLTVVGKADFTKKQTISLGNASVNVEQPPMQPQANCRTDIKNRVGV